MSSLRAEDWTSWEIDPSTRSSVHLWTKYIGITQQDIGTSAVTLVDTANRGIPAVNLATNPNIENADITMYTKTGGGDVTLARVAYSGEAISGSTTPNGVAHGLKVTRGGGAATSTTADGFYVATPQIGGGGRYGTAMEASVYVAKSGSATAAVEMVIQNAAGTTTLATGDAVTLTTSFQRISGAYHVPVGTSEEYRIQVRPSGSMWNNNTTAWYADMFMYELRTQNAHSAYVDGHQPLSSVGERFVWEGAADLSASQKFSGMTHVRGIKIINQESYHATNNIITVAFDDVAVAGEGIPIAGGDTFETNWPIEANSVSVIASSAGTTIRGYIWGVHSG